MDIFSKLYCMVSAMKQKSGTNFTTLNGVEFSDVRNKVLAEEGIDPTALMDSLKPDTLKGITFYHPGRDQPFMDDSTSIVEQIGEAFEVA